MSKKNLISSIVLIISLLLSLTLFIINGNKYSRLSFKYKYELGDRVVLEDRFVMLKGNSSQRAKIVLDELFLGPHSVFNKKLVPFNFKYNKFYINNNIAYLDLPYEIVTYVMDEKYDIKDVFGLITDNLLANIDKINSVVITVDNHLLGEGPGLYELPQGELEDKK